MALRGDKLGGGGAHSAAVQRDVLPVSCLVHRAKRIVDVAAATMGLLLFSPLFLVVSVAIKLNSRGALFVREARYGHKNRPIRLLRFRLVTARAENGLTGPQLTRVGRIISQSGIDELPQLFNVLCGEMSLVGPQPFRHPGASLNKVKPGMIRWAQIVATREERPDANSH